MIMIVWLLSMLTVAQAIGPQFFESGNEKPPPITQFGIYLIINKNPENHYSQLLRYYSELKCGDSLDIQVLHHQKQEIEELQGIYPKLNFHDQLFSFKTKGTQLYLILQIDKGQKIQCRYLQMQFSNAKSKSNHHIQVIGLQENAYVYEFIVENDYFSVYPTPSYKQQFFAFFSLNMTFVPYHIMKMYHLNIKTEKYMELAKINDYKEGACSGMLLNIIYSQLYPQNRLKIINTYYEYSKDQKSMKIDEDLSQCLNKFYQILKYNPLKLTKKVDSFSVKRFEFPFFQQTLLIKQSYYEMKYDKNYVHNNIQIQKIQQYPYSLPRKGTPYHTQNTEIKQEMDNILQKFHHYTLLTDCIGISFIFILIAILWVRKKKRAKERKNKYKQLPIITNQSLGDNT